VLAVSLNFPRSIYHIKDVVEGSIKFSLVKLKIKSMSLAIKRKEVLGSGVNSQTKEEQIMSFEIMDGCPTKEETIPIRLYLASTDQLGPSYNNINNKFSVQYFLHLLIIDVEDMKYFKNNEIQLYRQFKAITGKEKDDD
jgi:vacuolar protein sorting-associated protein 26